MTSWTARALGIGILATAVFGGTAQAQTSFDASGGGSFIPGHDARACDAAIEGAMRTVGAGPTYGLVGHWRLDETSGTTVYDSSSSANHGTLSQDAADLTASDSTGNYLQFDGSSSITVPHNAQYNITTTSPLTIAFWMNSSGEYGGLPLHKKTGTPFYGYDILSQSPRLQVGPANGTTGFGPNVAPVYTGGWVHIACVFDNVVNNQKYCYLNGTPDGGSYGLSGTYENTEPLTIGSGIDFAMKDVRVYSRELDQGEVQDMMSAPRTQICTDKLGSYQWTDWGK